MSESKKKKYSMKFKQLSDIPMGTAMDPENHSSNNLAVRGQVPLGQSGEQQMGLADMATPGNTGNDGAQSHLNTERN